ncbi:MAG: hypothetical protein JSR83_17720 [Proteobacteria bacterium]|nr:hypothetical protein [Pseudomonadota bacterium]
MASDYVDQCTERAFDSISELKKSGITPAALEISSDVWSLINMGGINMFPGQKIFAGLEVIEREDLVDHIKAV